MRTGFMGLPTRALKPESETDQPKLSLLAGSKAESFGFLRPGGAIGDEDVGGAVAEGAVVVSRCANRARSPEMEQSRRKKSPGGRRLRSASLPDSSCFE